ncbi:hypothetical protein HRW14_28775 [Streptomyces lunaelactis]|uniref:hypothetical protein n=1 Tax=Streptomyces lunaelactis TaxID=1535768 RepID=UPI00158456D7|nr:hypothetical protein [Streptomyces lunaelactis]NUK54191.1 hypothetical protein [Streptomyces lunaelactis]NUK67020.1 hypothetical protein [Streptomyces lunaelactis]
MCLMRKVLWAVSAAVVLVVGTGASAGAGDRVIAPEADVAHHGRVALTNGRLSVWLLTESHGPGSLANATVRLAFSVPPAGAQALPAGCLWAGDRMVFCATGALRAGGVGRQFALELRTVGAPDEVVVTVGTQWNGGATDRNPQNNEHRVLAPATGDSYAF